MNSIKMKERNINFSQRLHAILEGYSLKFNAAAPNKIGANIVPDSKEIVEGVLYDILESDLSKLDRYEEYPIQHEKIKVNVKLDNGQMIESFAYIAKHDKVKNGLKPSKSYIKNLLAAKDVLSKSYYKKIESVETLD